MKKLAAFILIILLSTPILAEMAASADRQTGKVIRLSTWSKEPFTSADGKGLLDLLLTDAFQRCCNLDVSISTLPAERSLKVANQGLMDGELPRVTNIGGPNRTYPNLIQVHVSVLPVAWVTFTKNPDNMVREWHALEPYHVAIVKGWKHPERKVKKYRSLTKLENERLLFRFLAKERVDVAILDRLVGLTAIHQLGLKDIYGAKAATFETPKDEWFLYMHKKHADLVPKLAKTLHEMKKDGSYAKLYCQSLMHFISPQEAEDVIMISLASIGATSSGVGCSKYRESD